MTRRLKNRIAALENQARGDDDEDLRYVITRRTVDGELIKKTECYYDEDGEWTTDEIDGFNFEIEYADPDPEDS